MDLYTASSLGISDIVRNEVKRNPTSILKPNSKGWTPIMYACTYCRKEIVNLCVHFTPSSVNSINSRGQTPLMLAAQSGDLNIVKLVTKPGILECKDDRGWTALFYAVHCGHENIICYLIKCGANVNARDYQTQSVLMRAIESGREHIIELLIAYGTNCDLATDVQNVQATDESKTALRLRYLQIIVLFSMISVTDLDNFLHIIGLDGYSDLFKKNQINLDEFLKLSETQLKLIGVNKLGPRRKMTLAAQKYNYLKELGKQLQNNSYL